MEKFVKIETEFDGLFIIKTANFNDERGFFTEGWSDIEFKKIGLDVSFLQDNISLSKRGVIRGMHGQMKPSQSKLVRCLSGEILDTVIDIRPKSKTFLQKFSIKLSPNDCKMLFVPHGFLHGFSALLDDSIVMYKVSGGYNKAGEFSANPLSYDIDWGFDLKNAIVSEKDKQNPSFDGFIKSEQFKEIAKTFD